MNDPPDTRAPATIRPIEVRVYQYGLRRTTEWCSSPREARQVADTWNRGRGVHCEIVGLSAWSGPAT